MEKPKVFVYPRNSLDKKMLAAQLDLVDNATAADFAIAWKDDIPGISRNRVVMCQSEPPIATGRAVTYQQFAEYHTVIRFDPDPNAANEFPFGDSPHLYPYRPAMSWRQEPEPDGKGIYFAGMKRTRRFRNPYGYEIIYALRSRIADRCLQEFGGECVGRGWDRNTRGRDRRFPDDPFNLVMWHEKKFIDIKKLNPMFVLSVENSRVPGYITEKFWDGLLSGRVMVYLGAPDLAEHVPTGREAPFIDASEFYGKGQDNFDLNGLIGRMKQVERDMTLRADILWKAKMYLDRIAACDPMDGCRKLTQFVIERINGEA